MKEVKLKAQGAAILDPNSDMDEVLESLEELHTIMNELQEKATEYKSYQKQFKVGILLSCFLPFVLVFLGVSLSNHRL